MRVENAARSVVRVRSGELAAGAGILLAPDLVATCAHVVADAVGEEYVPQDPPDGVVEVDLPLSAGGSEVVTGRVERWWPPQPDGTGDVAVLRLQRAYRAPVPSLRRVEQPWGRRFSAAGFPPGREDGQWAAGVLREHQGAGWVQLSCDGPGPAVGPGFSGAPVIDVDAGCVVAMAVAADRDSADGTAYALPIDQVLTLAPQVLANPYRGLAAFGEQDSEFFFGRAEDTARAVAALDRGGVVVVAGGSGVGKSSLLRAGVAASERDCGRPIATARITPAPSLFADGQAEPTGADPPATVREDVAQQLASALSEATPGNWLQLLRRPEDPAEHAQGGSTQPAPDHSADATAAAADPTTTTTTTSAKGTTLGPVAVPAGGVVLVLDQLEELAAAAPQRAQAAAEALLRLWRVGVRVAVTARWATFDVLTGPAAEWLRSAAIGISALDRQGLRSAVAEPARRTPGPSFAPGLAERIVDDAGDEPGRLPLVQALLAELWDQPDGALLTEHAYGTAGRVDGALTVSADRTWESLDADDQTTARRLLLAMTRPADGGFARAPLPLHNLKAHERAVVEVLARRRLVTVTSAPVTDNFLKRPDDNPDDESESRGPGSGGDVAELAHQALIDHWPLLGGWLVADADFLCWRDELRGATARWAPTQDPGQLLRGRALDTALGWDDTRRSDLDTRERAYLDASRRRATRDRRLRRGAVTGLATLLVVALVLSVVLAQSNSNLTRSLAAANARTLGQLALSQLATDPSSGTQLALAAYAADPDSADARSALGQAYLTRRSTTATRTIPGAGPITGLVVDPDVDISAFPAPADPSRTSPGGGGVVVGDGLQGDAPTYATVPGSAAGDRPVGVGGRGRWIVVADAAGRLSVWDRTGPAPARPLSGPVTGAELTPDGTRLITLTRTAGSARIQIVDLATAAPTGPAITLPDPAITRVWQTTDPTRLLVEAGAPNLSGSRLTVRDARTGTIVRAVPATAAVARQGAATVRCEAQPGATPTVTVDDAATGTPRRRINGDGDRLECSDAVLSADRRHVVLRSGSASTTSTPIKIYDIDTGRRGLAWVPPATGIGAFRNSTAAFGDASSTTTALNDKIAVRGDRALLVDNGAVDTLAFDTNQSGPAELGGMLLIPPRGEYVLVAYTDGVLAAGPGQTAPLGDVDLPDDQSLQAGIGNDLASLGNGISDNEIALVIAPTGRPAVVRDYSLPALTPLGQYDLAAAGAAGTPGAGRFGSSVQIGRSGDNTAILSGGVLSWWSPDHRLIGPPTTLSTDPATITALVDTLNDGLATAAPAAGQTTPVGDAVAVREPDGIGIYRPNTPPTRIRADLVPRQLNSQIRLMPDRLVAIEQPGSLVQRDPATGEVTAPPLPIAPDSVVVGTDSADRLITYDNASSTVRLWDLRANKPAGELVLPDSTVNLFNRGRSADGIWPISTGDQVLRLPVDAPAWHSKLCATQNRAFTDTEQTQLPDGADTDPPCGQE